MICFFSGVCTKPFLNTENMICRRSAAPECFICNGIVYNILPLPKKLLLLRFEYFTRRYCEFNII